jgi:hypothetical protein
MPQMSPKDSGAALRILTEKVEVLLGERGDKKAAAVRRAELDTIAEQLVSAILEKAGILSGTGTPECKVAAKVGTLYRGASTTLYVKQSGTGNTGWAAK